MSLGYQIDSFEDSGCAPDALCSLARKGDWDQTRSTQTCALNTDREFQQKFRALNVKPNLRAPCQDGLTVRCDAGSNGFPANVTHRESLLRGYDQISGTRGCSESKFVYFPPDSQPTKNSDQKTVVKGSVAPTRKDGFMEQLSTRLHPNACTGIEENDLWRKRQPLRQGLHAIDSAGRSAFAPLEAQTTIKLSSPSNDKYPSWEKLNKQAEDKYASKEQRR